MRAALLLVLALTACRFNTVKPIPLAGPAPTAVVVAPVVDMTGAGEVTRGVLFGLDRAVRDRGYRVLPLTTGLELLREHDLERAAMLLAPGLPDIKRFLDVDAVITLTVHRWEPVYDGGDLRVVSYDLEYRMTSTVFDTLLWQHRLEGEYVQPLQEPIDPMQERNPELETVPIRLERRPRVGSEAELVKLLHETAALHLPER